MLTCGLLRRHPAAILTKLDKLRDAIKEAEATLSAEMGYEGGSLNENYEVRRSLGSPSCTRGAPTEETPL
jgi:hypothetical protein